MINDFDLANCNVAQTLANILSAEIGSSSVTFEQTHRRNAERSAIKTGNGRIRQGFLVGTTHRLQYDRLYLVVPSAYDFVHWPRIRKRSEYTEETKEYRGKIDTG